MTATLRVVLDQLVTPTRPDLAGASRELAEALVLTAPRGCDVAAIVPAPGWDAPPVSGLVTADRMPLQRRELAASWQFGLVPGVGKGMLHSPTLLAPLVRHDRANETHQVVATLWDLRAWEAPDDLNRMDVLWQRAMLKRAEKHADAVVVPTHAMASRLSELGRFGGRVRVIAGAPPSEFRVPGDVVGRLRALDLPASFVATAGGRAAGDGLSTVFGALAGVDTEVVVLDCPAGEEAAVVELASLAGLTRVHVLGPLDSWDRAAVLGSASLYIAGSALSDWPWRAVEAVALGVPVVAVDSPTHHEVLVDAALLAPADTLGAAVVRARGADAARLRVMSADRAKSFSWREAAERVWQLHADL